MGKEIEVLHGFSEHRQIDFNTLCGRWSLYEDKKAYIDQLWLLNTAMIMKTATAIVAQNTICEEKGSWKRDMLSLQ
jgi:hypothetical protein